MENNNNKQDVSMKWGDEENILYRVSCDYQKGIEYTKKWPFLSFVGQTTNVKPLSSYLNSIPDDETEKAIMDFILTIVALLPLPIKFESMRDQNVGTLKNNYKVHLFKATPTFKVCYFHYKKNEEVQFLNTAEIVDNVYGESLKILENEQIGKFLVEKKLEESENNHSKKKLEEINKKLDELELQKKKIEETITKSKINPNSVVYLILKNSNIQKDIYIPLTFFHDKLLNDVLLKIKNGGKILLLKKKLEIYNNPPYQVMEEDGTIKKNLLETVRNEEEKFKEKQKNSKKTPKIFSELNDSNIDDELKIDNSPLTITTPNQKKIAKKLLKNQEEKIVQKRKRKQKNSNYENINSIDLSQNENIGKYKLKEDMYTYAIEFFSKLLNIDQSIIGTNLMIIDQTRKRLEPRKNSILHPNFQSSNMRDNGEAVISMLMRAFDVESFDNLAIMLEMLDQLKQTMLITNSDTNLTCNNL